MSIWNKVLLGFIFIGFVAWLFLATRAMNVQDKWRPMAQQLERGVESERQRRIDLIAALREARLELYELTVGRGRVWYNCVPQEINAKKHDDTGADTVDILVNIVFPEPHGVEVKTTLYIFEQAEQTNEQANQPNPAQYLGQFVVTHQMAQQLQIEPTLSPSPEELQALVQALVRSRQAGRRWSLHEIMPDDKHEIYANWDPADYMLLLPDETKAEYKNEPDRALRDYRVLFNGMHQTRSRNIDQIAALTVDNGFLDSAVASARTQEQFRNQELAELKNRLTEVASDRDAVQAHRLAVQRKFAEIETAVARSIETNQAILGEVTRLQLEATRIIDARTRRMAQVGPGR